MDRALALTATEHDLLCALARNASGVCSYDELARRVRHRHVDRKLGRTLGWRLRGELGDDGSQPVYILTARGVGYRMAKAADR